MYKPVVLVVLDGWGISNNSKGNVLKETSLPTIEKLDHFYPMTTLQASGISVGLFWGESGNSEVGHMAMGAGKIVYQNLPRITLSIQDKTFFENPALSKIMENVKKRDSSLHLLGLVGQGSVHSYLEHLFAILEMAKEKGLSKVFIHAFTDGRDSPQTSGTKTIQDLQNHLKSIGVGKIATLSGRNWGMDRNNNWDRVEKAYRLITEGKGASATDAIKCLQDSYATEITDEYIEPSVITENLPTGQAGNKPVAIVQDGDGVIFFNFREDRARELTKAFTADDFDGFQREKLDIDFVTLVEYEKNLPVEVAFPPVTLEGGLGQILSEHKLKQLRIAETEKYAHVTYFFNGGKEEAWEGEERILVPSPSVSKFDEAPEMSASLVTEKISAAIEEEKYDFILVNYANADMVGHTGNPEACVTAVQTIDKNLAKLIPMVLKKGGCLFITADHGNVEEIKNYRTGQVDTEHSSNPVPLWYVTATNHREKTSVEVVRQQSEVGGLLSDIAPTILELLSIQKPEDTNGESLLPLLK
ncbi:MAG: 2,3-bisphosphoglycerate-independent phosphoglycerate mutase [Candidatus Moranbacteria bacterium GW2011_GWD2_36_12]|nr:MAG: 2,3-bisphosphoglycerate-independent phosphoglycerate mutase [Candidatus Moranbacteria bacterium GW2011_GWD2_36_12]KKQ07199.1 MAG: 2,3-bisphosphoglycerate-independent phosphoglycerate mutase [Candidatus Moranbacteria bacterium GW2011_GWE2_36_40]